MLFYCVLIVSYSTNDSHVGSGLWGIFYYKEIAGGAKIAKWFGSAGLTISGIIWLSYQRIHAKQ